MSRNIDIRNRGGRNPVFDIMKGIGILCVMIGHTTWIPGWLDRIVYSFHIPLFFIVAGLFSKTYDEVKENKIEYIKHLAHRLLVPYVLVMIAVCVGAGVQALKYEAYRSFCRL